MRMRFSISGLVPGALPPVAAALCTALVAGGAGAGDNPPVPTLPSGLDAVLQEIVLDEKPDGQFDYARFRFVSPAIGGDKAPDFETRAADMDFLCQSYAWPLLSDRPDSFDRIVISLADRETEFGIADPEAVQFFEVYRVKNGACIWEEF